LENLTCSAKAILDVHLIGSRDLDFARNRPDWGLHMEKVSAEQRGRKPVHTLTNASAYKQDHKIKGLHSNIQQYFKKMSNPPKRGIDIRNSIS
jgi:hypothetical protein